MSPTAAYLLTTSDTAMTTEQTRQIIEPYLSSHDARYVAEDGVFIDMASGQRHEGREAVAAMLDYVYHRAFDARAEMSNHVVAAGKAVVEGLFVGTHIGEFAGIPATGREVRVPICVAYDVAEDGIKEARIYIQGTVMMRQLGVLEAPAENA